MAGLSVALRRFGGISVIDLARIVAGRTFQYAPKVIKYFVYLLFLFQLRSWPFFWHYIVFKPVFAIRLRFYLHRLLNTFQPAHVQKQRNLEWLEGLSKVGMNPFDLQVTTKSWAGPDDCDYNLHLSNSSYPKRLDGARLKAALELCPTFFRVGGWMGLGATHFTFLREIPVFSTYEMRVSIMSWDHKWLYVVTRFVTKPKKGKDKKAHTKSLPAPPTSNASPHASLHTSNGVFTPLPGSGSSSPPNGSASTSANTASENANATGAAAALAAQLIERPEPDGATVNCLSVSELVCKIGRLTIPPALMLAVEGFCCAPVAPGAPPHSHANPPPHWELVRALRGDTQGKLEGASKGSLRALRDFYISGWREIPEGERWWEDALGREVEERRLRGLGCMQSLRKGVDEARAI